MCGIVGYIGSREATPILLGGLRHLEYRGYDSAGIAVANGGPAVVVRAKGKLDNLEKLVAQVQIHGTLGIGHTRWATHGPPSERNAHPHKVGRISVVHNGIIENHHAIRARLLRANHTFHSDTDTELVAHLVDEALADGAPSLLAAVRVALPELRGSYALVVLSDDDKDHLIAAKNASPLVLGFSKGEVFVASDVPALLEHTRDVMYLEEGDIAEVCTKGAKVFKLDGTPVVRKLERVTWNAGEAKKAGYRHFMLKEIHEQPRGVRDTIRGRLDVELGEADLDGFHVDDHIKRIVAVACGTSYHASLVGKYIIEAVTHLPFEVDLASEFRYRQPALRAHDLVVATSQSGETADTLGAMKEAQARGVKVLAISNTVGSAIGRAADGTLYTYAGPEIGVASTKAFTTQLAAFALLAIHLARRTPGQMDAAQVLAGHLAKVPDAMEAALGANDAALNALVKRFAAVRDVLFLGRGLGYPVALEGALKLKEISYIHAEGYAAGEMKHGPIALIERGTPVIVIATHGPDEEKVRSNIAEVKARGAFVVGVTDNDRTAAECDAVLRVPAVPPLLQPLVTVLPLQQLAYRVAVARGNDVDQPRNLAKSVTVE
jgi:glucosamine--fructose-6-phosphate aminotransferase (isomerizing)